MLEHGELAAVADLWTPDRSAVATALDEQLSRSSRAFSSRRPISASESS
ncbi:hypothetical protein OG205_28575 [Lentzea sp. NBC_00516]|nr:hypothetical protein [Lentzea sp. NBC_00516]WUD22052.1 hypothetical protein OG205_28575 [Lentzea sp. NBC_00516]